VTETPVVESPVVASREAGPPDGESVPTPEPTPETGPTLVAGPTVVAGPPVSDTADAPPGDGSSSVGDPDPVVHPRVWQRRMAVLREQGRRRLRWVVAGVAVLVALCIALLVLHTPLLALRSATVRGAQHTGTQAVLQAAGLLSNPPLIDVDPKTVAADVEKLPWVAHAAVVRHWPDRVTITVTERVPLGFFPRRGGVAVVDHTGRVLAWQRGATTGLVLVAPVTPGRPGTVLAGAARPVLRVASALPASLSARVLEVSADAHGTVRLNLGGGVSAVLGPATEVQAKLTALATVLSGAHVSGPAVIDVTYPDEPTVGPPPPAP
jgi:cell division protein FtsQ